MSPRVRALAEDVRRRLAAAGDPERAAGQHRYMRSALPFHGVRVPEVRRLAKELVADHPLEGRAEWEEAVRHLWDSATHREERYVALRVAEHRRYRDHRTPEALDLLDHLVVTGAWWDLVDDVASHLVSPLLRAHRAEVAPVVRRWARDADLWRRRTAVLSQLGAKDETDTALLAEVCEANLDDPEFFLRKAIGWALREYARTDPDWVRARLAAWEGRVSPLSRREAAKHLG